MDFQSRGKGSFGLKTPFRRPEDTWKFTEKQAAPVSDTGTGPDFQFH
jgi:hypothetical protein